jgi:hypothetical protein
MTREKASSGRMGTSPVGSLHPGKNPRFCPLGEMFRTPLPRVDLASELYHHLSFDRQ